MLRRALICAAAIGCALSISACSFTSTAAAPAAPSFGSAVGSLVGTAAERFVSKEEIAKVQAAVLKGCNFEVEADTVVKVASSLAGYGFIGTGFDLVTTRICDTAKQSVVTASLPDADYAALKRRKPADTTKGVTPEGIPVKGRFVGKKKSG